MAKASSAILSILLVLLVRNIETVSLNHEPIQAEVDYVGGLVLYRVLGSNNTIEYVLLQKLTELVDWSVPKGKIDPGEDANLGAIREVFEETGFLEADYHIYSEVAIYFEYTTNDDIIKKVTLFPSKLISVDKPVVISPEEHNAYVWADYETASSIIKKQYKAAFTQAHSFIIDLENLLS